jgi:hypothetical protein
MKVIPWDGKPISAPGIFSNVPSAIYHGPDLCIRPSISSSGLRTIFTDSPMQYWIHSPYNPNRLPEEDSRAFVVGRAAHHLCLGEADFKKHFIVRPAEYPDQKTGELKKWTRAAGYCKAREAEWADDMNLDILTPEELETIKGIAGIQPWQKGLDDSGLMNSAVVRAGALQGLVEHTVVAIDKETGVFIKARPDVIPTASREAGDFKTTQSVQPYKLQQTLDDLRYDMQGEIVSRCLEQAADFRLTNFALIFAAKKEPHEVAVRELKPYDLDESAKDNQTAIRTFALCMERGKWPGVGGGEDDARYLERSDRSRERAIARREQLERGMFA